MKEVMKNLYVGDDKDCGDTKVNVVHACKTCHREGVGYTGNLPNTHTNYLILEENSHLYLNMVDMERELLAKFTNPIVKAGFKFIEQRLKADLPVLIHCNQGQSRSPSLALMYMARAGKIKNGSYFLAKVEFKELYPNFKPGRGIETYMIKNWSDIIRFDY